MGGEDPHVFKTKRGYHMLNHNTGPSSSGLSFSADGLTWTKGHLVDAFNATLHWSDGSITNLCRRQRPFVVMADDGMPGWLWNGVMDGPMAQAIVSSIPLGALAKRLAAPRQPSLHKGMDT